MDVLDMTTEQHSKLVQLCMDYAVPFKPEHYSKLSDGMVEGWVGGPTFANPVYYDIESDWYRARYKHAGRHTIFVGVEPDGRSHS